MADRVEAFPSLRPHQRHACHAFLVQFGAIVMERAGLAEPPSRGEEWESIIRALTPGCPDDEPWRPVVDDITKPAFMQPPARSKEREADFKSVATPDDSPVPGRDAEEMALSGSVLPTAQSGGPPWTRTRGPQSYQDCALTA